VSTAWSPNRNVTLYGGHSILWPGRFIRDTGPAEAVQFVGTHAQFRY
jgi:hypothetical protein